MDLNDWILALHLLSAVALVSALTIFSVEVAALWKTDDPSAVTSFGRLDAVANVMVSVGIAGTIIFGLWLAISIDAYDPWDGWVIAAIVLWVIASAVGKRTGDSYRETAELASRLQASGTPRSPELAAATGATRAFWLHVVTCVLVLLILIDMIWKPGA